MVRSTRENLEHRKVGSQKFGFSLTTGRWASGVPTPIRLRHILPTASRPKDWTSDDICSTLSRWFQFHHHYDTSCSWLPKSTHSIRFHVARFALMRGERPQLPRLGPGCHWFPPAIVELQLIFWSFEFHLKRSHACATAFSGA
ncbi:hypothetical protein AFLA_010091 [Aspergillus flavus NRRL3357]|nr:hypothetical protein AFLA_010091 [Aspergillus flavus NRRL3357]